MRKLLYGDCLKLLKLVAANSIDMVLGDLPYGTTQCPWDTPIDLIELWVQLKRVCKPTAAICMFAQTPFDKVLGVSNLPLLRYEWIWEKPQPTGHFNAKKCPMKAHENVLVFYTDLPIYNPQFTNGHAPINSYVNRADVINKSTVYGKVTKDVSYRSGETTRYPRSVQLFSSDKQKMKTTGFTHATQKPVALCEYFIKTYTHRGQLVLDMTCGSGTTAVACDNLDRNWIAMENDKKEYGKAKNRIEKNYLRILHP